MILTPRRANLSRPARAWQNPFERRGICCLVSLGLVAIASCDAPKLPLAGRVLIDGRPMDSGTIRFEAIDERQSVGGAVEMGDIQLPTDQPLEPGKYRVEVQAFKKTGRVVADPQRGSVDEMVPMTISNSPREIEITGENHDDLQIEFNAAEEFRRP